MNVILHGKRDFADVIKLRVCDGEIILYYPSGSNAIISPHKNDSGRSEGGEKKKDNYNRDLRDKDTN